MSDINRIAEILREQYPGLCDCGTCTAVWAHHVARILDDELHPVIETVEQLDALPRRALVRDEQGEYWEKYPNCWDCLSEDGSAGGLMPTAIRLPARVLYTPEDSDG